MIWQLWFLILAGPFLAVAPFVGVTLREFPELLLGRRPAPQTARVVRPVQRWAVA